MTEQPEPILTLDEMAHRLTMSRDALHQRIALGELTVTDGRVTVTEFERFRDARLAEMVAHYADDIEADLFGDVEG